MDESGIWRRAEAICAVSAMRVATESEVQAYGETKKAMILHEKAVKAAEIIKSQLLELAHDRKMYIEALDRILARCVKGTKTNARFWKRIEAIVLEETPEFKLQRPVGAIRSPRRS
jgi:hypothetical protein